MQTPLILKYREGKNDKADWFEVVEPVTVELSDGKILTIPQFYVTDFASVPRFMWSLIPPIGKYNRACLVHDYLYDTQYRQKELGTYNARKFADREMLRIANNSNPKDKVLHFVMYQMVRYFGLRAWRNKK